MSEKDMHEHADFSRTLASSVRLRRKELGLRQEELADLAGVSVRLVHTVEAGKATLQLDKLLLVLDALGLTLALESRLAARAVSRGVKQP